MNARTAAAVVAGAAALAWLGLRVPPRPLRRPLPGSDPGETPLPDDLPAPVARHYRAAGFAGPTVPRVDTFALWGRARMKMGRLPWLPVTFWSEHVVGRSGRQELAVTWYGLPVLRGVDDYVGGRGTMRIGGRRVTGPEIDQGENLFLWAEAVLVPSVVATRPGVRWEAIDDRSARLRVPFGTGGDELVVRFDPETGLMHDCRAMRYRTPGQPKVGWHIRYERWRPAGTGLLPTRITVRWEDHERPWFVLDVDGFAANVAVSADLSGDPAGSLRSGTEGG